MSVLDPKSRTLSFRLSQREYAVAEAVSREQSFDSVSDFARHAVLSFTCAGPPEKDGNELRQMKQRIDLLVQEITHLSKKVCEG